VTGRIQAGFPSIAGGGAATVDAIMDEPMTAPDLAPEGVHGTVVEVPWAITPQLVARAEAESRRLFDVVREGTYPSEWPVVAWLVKLIAAGRCDHCGRRRRLAVHHFDRDKLNLQHWNLVALCWMRCHLWGETHLSLDRDQLDLFGDDYPAWLAWRIQDRDRWPLGRRLAPVATTHRLPDPDKTAEGGRPCACGCGERVTGQQRNGRPRLYFSQACRQRVYREGRRAQLSLLGQTRR
jgi:hypothetical protein